MTGASIRTFRWSLYWIAALALAFALTSSLVGLHLLAKSDINYDQYSAIGGLQQFIVDARACYQSLFPNWFRAGTYLVYISGIYVLIPLALFLESRFPADPKQPLISPGFWQDSIWFIAHNVVFKLTIFFIAGDLLSSFYAAYLSFLTIEWTRNWSLGARLLLGLIVADFLGWLSHLIRHKVAFLWFFHSVHHSQEQMNVFTDARVHPVDTLARMCITFIPFYMLYVPAPAAVAFIAVVYSMHGHLVHLNVKANLGPLRYLFVSPQFHRVHHSKIQADHDTNFGAILSIWDYIFGTANSSKEAYPSTGIEERNFPREQYAKAGFASLITWLHQLVYPFLQVWGVGRQKEPANASSAAVDPGTNSGHH